MVDENTDKALELAIAHLDRQFGKGTVIRLGNENMEPWPAISTGALTLDLALGIGGLPKGRIIEIYGPESSGKTTVALTCLAQAQQEGGTCAFIDTEHSLDPVYAKALGVNMDDLLMSQPNNGEEALEVLDALVGTGQVTLIVLDSVAALVSKAELEGDMGQAHMAPQARLMSQALRKLVGRANKTNTIVIFTNQLREKVGFVLGNPEIQPGGRALKFYASIRMEIRRIKDIKSKDGVHVGIEAKATIKKNKLAPPYKIAYFDILYGRGINWLGCIVDAALEKEIFTLKGTWINYQDTTFAQGRERAIETLAADLDLARDLEKQIKS